MPDHVTLTLKPQEIDYLMNLIAQRPLVECYALFQNLQQQVQSQAQMNGAVPGTGLQTVQ